MTKKKRATRKSGCVVQRRKEKLCHPYDERKVYGSVYASCYVTRMKHRTCEKVADKVAKAVTSQVKRKKEVHAHTISTLVTKELKKHSKAAAFMYETHRDIT